jgi:hypothetical protein
LKFAFAADAQAQALLAGQTGSRWGVSRCGHNEIPVSYGTPHEKYLSIYFDVKYFDIKYY